MDDLHLKAEQGGTKAQFNLGVLYEGGDDVEAAKWYRKAAD